MNVGLGTADYVFLLVCFIPGFLALTFSEHLIPFRSRAEFDKISWSTALGFAIFSITVILGDAFKTLAGDARFYLITPWILILPVGAARSLLYSNRWLQRFLRFLRLSRRVGGTSCWDAILSVDKPHWVRVHLTNGYCYVGWVELFTDLEPFEIVIHPLKMSTAEGIIQDTFEADDRVYIPSERIVSLESLSTVPNKEDADV
jgi:hypothetical protein